MTTTLKACDVTPDTLVRHLGLYARDLYELSEATGPHLIRDERTTVRWDPVACAAVFDLDGIALTVPSSALDDVGLAAADASFRTTEARPAPTTNKPQEGTP